MTVYNTFVQVIALVEQFIGLPQSSISRCGQEMHAGDPKLLPDSSCLSSYTNSANLSYQRLEYIYTCLKDLFQCCADCHVKVQNFIGTLALSGTSKQSPNLVVLIKNIKSFRRSVRIAKIRKKLSIFNCRSYQYLVHWDITPIFCLACAFLHCIVLLFLRTTNYSQQTTKELNWI